MKRIRSYNIGAEISSVCFDSRQCTPGSLFVAINGNEADGHKYIDKAIENGAAAVIYQDGELVLSVPSLKVADSRKALSEIAAEFYDYPSAKLNLVGVTGT
ncbi:MAG: UDP-N-acetylmuramoyl-L-alanyl-D-glutamate--2,6-diaminopimelate ligase, partial [Bacteroidales bacterium]|nr:UDP-N-acetylmuramoyl-L-alanyl-D-glutamate--2,6-diaminopimelate ligase [Bacteroidales bacterium]